jgi:hypothetical protein
MPDCGALDRVEPSHEPSKKSSSLQEKSLPIIPSDPSRYGIETTSSARLEAIEAEIASSAMQSSLLDLPAEVISLILTFLDPSSLYVASLSCRTLRAYIFSRASRVLLQRQLRRVPGRRLEYSRLTSQELGRVFRHRVKENLLHGVSVLADRTSYLFPARPRVKTSVLHQCDDKDGHVLLIAHDGASSIVHVHNFYGKAPHAHYTLDPCLSTDFGRPLVQELRSLEVVQVCLLRSMHNPSQRSQTTTQIAVLYKYSLHPDRNNDFVRKATDKSDETLILAIYSDQNLDKFCEVQIESGEEVLAMAADRSDRVFILVDCFRRGRQLVFDVPFGDGMKSWHQCKSPTIFFVLYISYRACLAGRLGFGIRLHRFPHLPPSFSHFLPCRFDQMRFFDLGFLPQESASQIFSLCFGSCSL